MPKHEAWPKEARPSGIDRGLTTGIHSADEAGEYKSFSRPNIAESTRDDKLFVRTTGTPMASTDSEYGFKSKEPLSARPGRAKVIGKGGK